MSQTKVSVIIPTFRPGKYLWDCLRSLKNQTLQEEFFEVIIVLNGCSNPYNEAIRNFLDDERQWNALLIQTDEVGVSNARNIGIENARGSYITFIDDDDYVSEAYLEELLGGAGEGVMPVSNVVAFIDETGAQCYNYLTKRYSNINGKGRVGQWQARSFFSVPVAKLLERGAIGERRFRSDLRNGEDSVFMFEISDSINGVEAVNEKAVYYRRIRQGSASMVKRAVKERATCSVKQLRYYTGTYFKGMARYNLFLYISRVVACLLQWTGVLDLVERVKSHFVKIRRGGVIVDFESVIYYNLYTLCA